MDFANAVTILLSCTSLCAGALLGALRSKLFAAKGKTKLHTAFYAFSGIVFLAALIFGCKFWPSFKEGWGLFVLISTMISSGALLIFTKFALVTKDTYKTAELDPVVNKFTADADKNEIRLFGGDLNFFGNTPSDMDKNSQYIVLRSKAFDRVLILCEAPRTTSIKICYGKILKDMPATELRFYSPREADLRLRGRIIKMNSVFKLLMYAKVESGIYRTIQTDMANSDGALYTGIWDLAWALAERPTEAQLTEYKSL